MREELIEAAERAFETGHMFCDQDVTPNGEVFSAANAYYEPIPAKDGPEHDVWFLLLCAEAVNGL